MKKSTVLIAQIIQIATSSQCLVSKLDSQRPDTACCNMSSEKNQCLFTSSCNQLGVCCQDPTQFEAYEPL